MVRVYSTSFLPCLPDDSGVELSSEQIHGGEGG